MIIEDMQTASALGALIGVRRNTKTLAVFIAGGIACLWVLQNKWAALQQPDNRWLLAVVGFGFLLTLCGACLAYGGLTNIYVNGFAIRRLFHPSVYFFKDIDNFAYGITRHRINGIPAWTEFVFTFLIGKKKIRLTDRVYFGTSELSILADQTTKALADNLMKVIREKGRVKWVEKVELTPAGVEHDGTVYKFEGPIGVDFQDGVFVFGKVGGSTSVTIPAAAMGFHPGYFVFQQLIKDAVSAGLITAPEFLTGEILPVGKETEDDQLVSCQFCGIKRKWKLFKKYGGDGDTLTCYSCGKKAFAIG